ncbi:MAG: 8-amino-7-oxononanoate synthase [Kangiellaceae bacterium]
MNPFEKQLGTQLQLRKSDSQWRERLLLQSKQSAELVVDDTKLINFSSNDYLGLASNLSTIESVHQQLDSLGVGSGASHLVSGHHQIHQSLEKEVAKFLKRDSAVTFSTGYMANLGILQSLAKKGELIIADKLNHASLIDGAKLSNANSVRYQHCDMSALEKRLISEAPQKWVVTDGVFSMDGDLAPLDKIAGMCKKYQANLIVDDAHGVGVVGEQGQGCAEFFNLDQNQLPVLMGTFGKAIGGFGAFVTGSRQLTDYLVQFARPYIYTTAMPAILAAANLHNLRLIKNDTSLMQRLKQNITKFKLLAEQAGLNLLASDTAIQPIVVGDSDKLVELNRQLIKAGYLVGAIRPPTVPVKTDRLRITLSAQHTEKQIKGLIEQLNSSIND